MADTLPPNDRDAERALLGAVLKDEAQLDDAALIVGPDDFYTFGHRLIFAAMLACREAARPIDPVTLANELHSRAQIDDAGGYAYIADVFQVAAVSHNATHYADIIRSNAHKRRLIHALEDAMAAALDPSLSHVQAQEATERRILDVGEVGQRGKTMSMPAATMETLADLDRRMKLAKEGKSSGIQTGMADLDRICCGLQRAELCIIGARTSVGKTAFAVNLAANAAMDGTPVFFVGLEQRKTELISRMWCRLQRIDSWRMRKAHLSPDDVQRILDGKDQSDKWPMEWDDAPSQSLVRIAANARRLKRQGKLGLLIIDYLQLIEPEDRKSQRNEQVAAISRRLKLLSRELDVPLIVLAQLNRNADKGDRPRLSDLRESGSIEQDADTVLLLHRAEDDDGAAREIETIQVFIAKQRNGPTDVVNLIYRRNYCSFEDWAPSPSGFPA